MLFLFKIENIIASVELIVLSLIRSFNSRLGTKIVYYILSGIILPNFRQKSLLILDMGYKELVAHTNYLEINYVSR